jgi:hypothetical protein
MLWLCSFLLLWLLNYCGIIIIACIYSLTADFEIGWDTDEDLVPLLSEKLQNDCETKDSLVSTSSEFKVYICIGFTVSTLDFDANEEHRNTG